MSKSILVTGGSGYIGVAVCKKLAAAGHDVVNLDHHKREIDNVTCYPFDIENHQIKGLLHVIKPDAIIHLAANHEVGRSVIDPGVFYANNVANTISLLGHAAEVGTKNFIYSSSSSVYGSADVIPTPETYPCNPESPYARTKRMVEQILEDYKNAYGFNYTSLRYFNAAGALEDGSHGYTQEPATHLIPIVAQASVYGNKVKVYGTDYITQDGTAERDYTHVSDIAEAHVLALDYMLAGGKENIFNIGTGVSTGVISLINKFNEMGYPVTYRAADRRPGDVASTCADISLARRELGYAPKYNLDDIITHSVTWARKHKKRKLVPK